ncbi:hypothetical protein BCA37_10640 [Mycobacterium sp. djl-10]|nr:hypothetical protein BCA37_10640 [Mycobacterium sp. djl-10]
MGWGEFRGDHPAFSRSTPVAAARGDLRVAVDEAMLVSAVRYALARQTYIVGWTVDELIRVWTELSPAARANIERDVIAQLMATGLVGVSSVDRPEWDRLLVHIAAVA